MENNKSICELGINCRRSSREDDINENPLKMDKNKMDEELSNFDMEMVGDRMKENSCMGDETDAISVYTIRMLKDTRYYMQHPYIRLFVAYFVVFLNFLIYAEDPVAHSITQSSLPVLGNVVSLMTIRWPDIVGYVILKVFISITFVITGLIVGKFFIHGYVLRKVLRLSAFRSDQGSFMIMFFTTIFSTYLGSLIYNLFLQNSPIYTQSRHGKWLASQDMKISNAVFMKLAATGTWCGDLFTACFVSDMMLQEKLYPHWAVTQRTWWRTKRHRIIVFWLIILISSLFVISVISTDIVRWDQFNMNLVSTSELSRAFLASAILCLDLLIVVQDWDFPTFMENLDLKLPGFTTAQFRLRLPANLTEIQVQGKWFNYGIIFIVMLLDLNMWKNQIFYKPEKFGQYVSPNDSRIYTVTKPEYLPTFNISKELTYEWRSSHVNFITNRYFIEDDVLMNAKFIGYSLGVKSLALIPCIIAFLAFGFSVWYFGRFVNEEDGDVKLNRLMKIRKSKRNPIQLS